MIRIGMRENIIFVGYVDGDKIEIILEMSME